jgi:hypothetical protein
LDGKRELADGPPIGDKREFAKATLRDLAVDHNFFTPGCFFTHGGMPERMNPVMDYISDHSDGDCAAFRIDLPWQPFRGIARDASEEAWDRRLYVTPRRFWDDMLKFLKDIVLKDTPRRRVAFARPQLLMIPDRLQHELHPRRDGRIPLVPVTAFGVTGTHVNCSFLPPPPRRVDAVAAVWHMPIDPDAALRGRRLLADDASALL